ncbi:MAG: hypothetical protein WB643_10235 [Candidatus Bathyarchaeia archaeon]
MPKKGRPQETKSSARTYSFLGTLLLLAIIVASSYYSSLPKVEHIPDNFQINTADWMKFVPQNAQYVSFVNYQAALTTSGNVFLFGSQAIFQFYQLNVNVPPQSITFDLDVQLPQAGSNSAAVTVSVIGLRNDTLSFLINELAKTNTTGSQYDGYPAYNLLVVSSVAAQQKLISAYVAIVSGALVLSIDPNSAKYGVKTILDKYVSSTPTLFDNSDVRRGVYASGAAGTSYIALFVGTFSSQFNNTRMIVKSVIQNTNGISVTRSVLFPSSDFAMSEIGHAHNVYRNADSYRILDDWLVISYSYSIDKLRGELTGI